MLTTRLSAAAHVDDELSTSNLSCSWQVEEREAALATLQDQVQRVVEDGGETRDRIQQLQARTHDPAGC